MSFSLGEYQDIFLEEADEQLQELNQNLLELEKNPENQDIINNIFRSAHSLKSSAAFVGLNDLSDLAHKMENLLQEIRDRTMVVSPDIVDLLFNCFDIISSVIDDVNAGKQPQMEMGDILERIQNVGNKQSAPGKAPKEPESQKEEVIPKTQLTVQEMKKIRSALESGQSCCEVIIFIEHGAQMKFLKAHLIQNNLNKISNIVTTIPLIETLNEENTPDILKFIILTAMSPEDIKSACDIDQVTRVDLRKISQSVKNNKPVLKFHERETLFRDSHENGDNGITEQADAKPETADAEHEYDDEQFKLESMGKKDDKKTMVHKVVKVSIDKLDLLLNNVGELVIANSGFFRLYEELRKNNYDKAFVNDFKNRMDQMSRIAKDLQTGIMKTRMLPIGQVFSRFNRLIRDLAKEFSKEVKLMIKGEETELDKKVIDAIGEPLMHLLRNAIDHGIESPDERKNLGKSPTATVTLDAHQSGNQIFVQVSDDGRGLDVNKIKKKVIDKGLSTQEALSNMDDEDIYNFIYHPGFSTVDVVTDISGRGVGMNVVKEIVFELNGNVSIETEPGMGTRFIMAFPLTLAIIPGIMVKVGKETYAIPLSDVIETIKIEPADITTIEGHEVINLRGEILSLLRLNEYVGIKSILGRDNKVPVVVVGYGNRKIGLIVDTLEGKLEIVIKSLEQNYKTVEGLAGASILGDGSICLILDVISMINKVIAEQDKISREKRLQIIEKEKAKVEEVESGDEPEFPEPDTAQELPPSDAIQEVPAEPELPVQEEASEPDTVTDETSDAIKEDIVFERKLEQEDPLTKENGQLADKTIEPEPEAVPDVIETGEDNKDEESEVRKKVKDILKGFREELRESVKTTMQEGDPDDHMKKSLHIEEEDINRLQLLSNLGIANAADSLSKLLDKQIDLSIPEVTLMPVEKIPESIGEVDNIYIGVYMPLVGEIQGTILFGFMESAGLELIDHLYGIDVGKTRELDDDGESALKEITNIVGSSVINVFSEKTGIAIKPEVPTIVHDYMQSILDSILVMYNISSDYALILDTEFYYQEDKIIGKFLIMPEAESLKYLVEKLK